MGRFLEGFGCQLGSQVNQKIYNITSCWPVSRNSKKCNNLYVFFTVLECFGLPTSRQNWQKNVPRLMKTQAKIDRHVGPVLNPFLNKLGSILGGFCLPSWNHVRTKWDQNPSPQRINKNCRLSESLQNDFESIFGPNMAPKRRNFSLQNRCFLALGAFLGPRWPQEAPKTASKTDFGAILVDLLLICC